MMIDLCQCILDGRIMHDDWKTRVIESIFKGRGDVMNCGSCRRVKLQEYVVKTVGRVL